LIVFISQKLFKEDVFLLLIYSLYILVSVKQVIVNKYVEPSERLQSLGVRPSFCHCCLLSLSFSYLYDIFSCIATQPNITKNQESEWSCICELWVSILSFSTIVLLDFGTVPTVWYFFLISFYYWL
jgi:hypothetical protein